MPLPLPPTFLLVCGGIMLIVSRWIRSARWCEGMWVASVIGTIWLMCLSPSPTLPVWVADPLGLAGQIVSVVLGILLGLGSFGSQSFGNRPGSRFGYLAFQTAGLMLVSAANDTVTLALSIEIVQFASLALRRRDSGIRAALQELVASEVSSTESSTLWVHVVTSLCLWIGIALLVQVTSSSHYDEIRVILRDAYQPGPSRVAIGTGSKLGLLAMGFIIAGLGSRLGLVPWQVILHHAGRGVGYWTAGSVILSSQLAGLVALTRLCGTVWIGYRDELMVLLSVLSGLTFVVAGSLAVLGLRPGEGRLRRWCLSFAMLHGAWMTVGLLAAIADLAAPGDSLAAAGGQPGALSLLLFAAGTYVIAMSGLFMMLSYLSRENHELEFVDELMGLGQMAPVSASVLMALIGSLVCQPPFLGFWSNWLISVAAFNVRSAVGRDEATPHDGMIALVVIALVTTLMFVGVAVRIGQFVVLESPLSRNRPQGNRAAAIVSGVCAAVLLLGGIAPARLLSVLSAIRGPGKVSVPDLPSGPSRGQSTARR